MEITDKRCVLNEQMRESLSKKAEEYSKEAETRREPEVGGEADFDLNTLGGDGAEARIPRYNR